MCTNALIAFILKFVLPGAGTVTLKREQHKMNQLRAKNDAKREIACLADRKFAQGLSPRKRTVKNAEVKVQQVDLGADNDFEEDDVAQFNAMNDDGDGDEEGEGGDGDEEGEGGEGEGEEEELDGNAAIRSILEERRYNMYTHYVLELQLMLHIFCTGIECWNMERMKKERQLKRKMRKKKTMKWTKLHHQQPLSLWKLVGLIFMMPLTTAWLLL